MKQGIIKMKSRTFSRKRDASKALKEIADSLPSTVTSFKTVEEQGRFSGIISINKSLESINQEESECLKGFDVIVSEAKETSDKIVPNEEKKYHVIPKLENISVEPGWVNSPPNSYNKNINKNPLTPLLNTSIAYKVACLMAREEGVSLEEIKKIAVKKDGITPWSDISIAGIFYMHLYRKGIGTKTNKETKTYHIVLPEGVSEIPVKINMSQLQRNNKEKSLYNE